MSESLAKRPRLDEDEGREDEELQLVGEEGEGLDVDVPVLEVAQRLTDVAESERKLAMMKAGKSLEARQQEFKEMLLERGVREREGGGGAGGERERCQVESGSKARSH